MQTKLVVTFSIFTLLAARICLGADPVTYIPVVPLTSSDQRVLTRLTLGVIVNLDDPNSVALGDFYIKSRDIPLDNKVEVRLPKENSVSSAIMQKVLSELEQDPRYPGFVAFALAFDRPYRLDENQSITSAFSQGVAQLTWRGSCNMTISNPDRASPPGSALQTKPSMLLSGGTNLESSLALVQRGIRADMSEPAGTILLMRTSDSARSKPREHSMEDAKSKLMNRVWIFDFAGELPTNSPTLLGFQTGLARLPDLSTIRFVPGAYADSLTSFGGALNDRKGQTTVSDLIRAGATASYGTVREPCNFAEKFSNPLSVASNYLSGDTLLEAYWKSVGSVTEGLFVGEPLARPFPLLDASLEDDIITLKVNRQTKPYIFNASETSSRGNNDQNERKKIDIYAVDAGNPVFLKNLTVSATIRVGDTIAKIPFAKQMRGSLTLGVINHQAAVDP